MGTPPQQPDPSCSSGKRPQLPGMSTNQLTPTRPHLSVAYVLAQLLERLEHSNVPVGAEQYQSVVKHLVDEFDTLPSAALSPLLDTHPAAAELYENLQYSNAGLCRSPLEAAMEAELRAREVIGRVMRGSRPAA